MKKIDIGKIKKIEKILKDNPKGLWIREISRKIDLDKSTVSIYLRKHMKSKVSIKKLGSIKIVRLKK